MSTERDREDRHNTVKESRLTQERQCAKMSLSELKEELSKLQHILRHVNDEHDDRRATIDSLSARIDVVRGHIVDALDAEQAQGYPHPSRVTPTGPGHVTGIQDKDTNV